MFEDDENELATTIISSDAMPGLLPFADGLTFREFAEHSSLYGHLLRQRYAEIRLPPEQQQYLVDYPDVLHLALVAAEDSPDTVAILPVIQRLVDASPRLTLYIWHDDDDLSALDARVDEVDLSDDSDESDDFDVPLLLIFDEEGEYQAQWGPRPAAAEAQLEAWLAQHPTYQELTDTDDDESENQEEYLQLLDELTYQMRVWYNSDLNDACVDELRKLLDSLQSDDEDGDDDSDDEENSS
jgi:hypothetical protein